jgi:hypothetical protein
MICSSFCVSPIHAGNGPAPAQGALATAKLLSSCLASAFCGIGNVAYSAKEAFVLRQSVSKVDKAFAFLDRYAEHEPGVSQA